VHREFFFFWVLRVNQASFGFRSASIRLLRGENCAVHGPVLDTRKVEMLMPDGRG
jgi:hypothetical protein